MPRAFPTILSLIAAASMAACGPMPVAKIDSHLRTEQRTSSTERAAPPSPIPAPVRQVALPPPPQPKPTELKYSVVVSDVPIREVLYAMARETKLNIDVHPSVEGRVTLNIVDQTIRQILHRISKVANVRIEEDGPNLSVVPDTPFLKTYKIDYLNVSRETTGSFGVQSLVVADVGGGGAVDNNSSSLTIKNSAKNEFWRTLEKNLRDIIIEEDKLIVRRVARQSQAEGSSPALGAQASGQARTSATVDASGQPTGRAAASTSAADQQVVAAAQQQLADLKEANPVIVNAETSTLSVRATGKQHERIAEFLESITGAAKRQVLIEATVVEVRLYDEYKSGVDWSALGLNGLGYTIQQSFTPPQSTISPSQSFTIGYSNPNAAAGGSISSSIKLLNSFGTTKVLSSPKIMTLNNQTAVLKVVTNEVYFSVKQTRTEGTANTAGRVEIETLQKVVPVGFVMSVTPQISDGDMVVLNIRPNVSSVRNLIEDPNPIFAAGTKNQIPVIATREFETMLRIPSGQTAILGGLMQDRLVQDRGGLPLLSRIPLFGDAVSSRDEFVEKIELVIFIRPVVIKDASVETDLADYRRFLPDRQFFKEADPLVPGLMPPFDLKSNPVVPDSPAASPPKSAP